MASASDGASYICVCGLDGVWGGEGFGCVVIFISFSGEGQCKPAVGALRMVKTVYRNWSSGVVCTCVCLFLLSWLFGPGSC